MTASILLYVTLFAVCLLLARTAQKKNKTEYVWLIILALTLVVGLRAYSVGIDTANYVRMFQLVAREKSNRVYGAERSFLLLVKALQIFHKSPSFILLAFSFITNTFVLFRAWEFRDRISFPTALLYFFGNQFFLTFNIVRQMVAVALIFWGTRYVEKSQYKKFLLVTVIAALFHQSALLGLVYLVVDILVWEKKRKALWHFVLHAAVKHKKMIKPAIVMVLLALVLIGVKASKYIHYFTNISFDIGLLVPLKLVVLTVFVLHVRMRSGKWGGVSEDLDEAYVNRDVVVCYGLGLCIAFAGSFFAYMNRIGLYFTPYGCLFWGYIEKSDGKKWLKYAAVAVIILWPLWRDIVSGGQGQLPYMFIWQN